MNAEYSHKRAVLVVLAVILYVTLILPYKLYSLNVVDRHYFGYFDDLDPQIAVTTAEERSYKAAGVPYKTLHDIKVEEKEELRRQKAGERGQWDHHYEKFYVSNMARRMLESVTGGRNLADDETTGTEDDSESRTDHTVVEEDAPTGFDSKFPEAFFTIGQIKKGGFLVYFAGIIYSFIGIALITQNYINPAIDIIKKKGILSSDMMNATLLAFSNSAAESFIVLNSILFGVSDIGIQTAVQQSAFSAMIIMGIFYRLAPEDTRIDWWISTRDSILFIVYLVVQSYFLIGNEIDSYAIYVLIVIYVIHVILMKLNHPVEVMIKKSVANYFEVRELHRLADENIQHFHYNLDSRTPCLELLNKIKFRQEGEILVFETSSKMAKFLGKKGGFMGRQNNQLRYRMKPIQSIKIADERFATPDDKFLMAKARWKQAVIKVLTKLQAYHIYEKIKRNKYCVIPVARFVKGYTKDANDKVNSTLKGPAGPSPNKSMYGSVMDVTAEGQKSGL